MTNSIILFTDLAAEASGYTISVVSIIVVFLSLTVLVLIFMAIPKLLEMKIKSSIKKTGATEVTPSIKMDADINAAIAMGLHMYFNELHDEESNVITIHNAPKQYSPWSSKIYGVQNQPLRK